jgi:predicted Zn finger-like uncharacterized protein
MRLICPNCDAEYQVDDAAIPETGRDVQCSNCGHAWFQLPADAETAREAEDELFGETPSDAKLPPASVVENAPAAAAPEASPPQEDDTADEATELPEGAPAAAARQTLDESVLAVLREEAERETAVRREEDPALRSASAGTVETQTEFGLDDAAAATSAAARHIARLKGVDPDALSEPDLPPEIEAKASARRDLLPDIEEINSTLRANSDRTQDDEDDIDALPDLRPKRRGFRSGFVLMMVVAVVLAMAYIMAPRIVAQIPGSAPTMKAYVAAVDTGRLWLDGMMKSASGSLRGLSGNGN